MPNLQSGAQSLILCAQTPCTEQAAATELSYASSSTFPSKHKPEHTWQIRLHAVLAKLEPAWREYYTKTSTVLLPFPSALAQEGGLKKYIHPPVLRYTCHNLLLKHLQSQHLTIYGLQMSHMDWREMKETVNTSWFLQRVAGFLSHCKGQVEKWELTLPV